MTQIRNHGHTPGNNFAIPSESGNAGGAAPARGSAILPDNLGPALLNPQHAHLLTKGLQQLTGGPHRLMLEEACAGINEGSPALRRMQEGSTGGIEYQKPVRTALGEGHLVVALGEDMTNSGIRDISSVRIDFPHDRLSSLKLSISEIAHLAQERAGLAEVTGNRAPDSAPPATLQDNMLNPESFGLLHGAAALFRSLQMSLGRGASPATTAPDSELLPASEGPESALIKDAFQALKENKFSFYPSEDNHGTVKYTAPVQTPVGEAAITLTAQYDSAQKLNIHDLELRLLHQPEASPITVTRQDLQKMQIEYKTSEIQRRQAGWYPTNYTQTGRS